MGPAPVPPAVNAARGDVRVHSDEAARTASLGLGADALTIGNHIYVGDGASASTEERRQLLRHEMTHVVQSRDTPALSAATHLEVAPADGAQERQAAAGGSVTVVAQQPSGPDRAIVHRKPRGTRATAPERSAFPWEGQIANTWTAALRSAPRKDPTNPHRGTAADLDSGTAVLVVNRKSGWLKVHLADGRSGWVSQELVEFIRASAFELGTIVVSVHVPTMTEAFIHLKRAETARNADPSYSPPEDDAAAIAISATVLEKTGRYVVDRSTYRVSFAPSGTKRTIDTIEDFILFVETVEREYPSASPGEIASEVRQIWFSDSNWELLSAGRGVVSAGTVVDIETMPNPIAKAFDMKDLAPAHKPSKPIVTRMGTIGMGHVLSGIDTTINGFPSSSVAGATSGDSALKYSTLKAATGGDSRDFATWSGDLGQAYGDYLVERYIRGVSSASLAAVMATEASPDALMADIHGYIARQVWRNTPVPDSPSGSTHSVSAILRDLYLVPKTARTGLTYREYFERASGKSGASLDSFMIDRVLAFARPWFAKKLVDFRGNWLFQDGWTKSDILTNALVEFDTYHALNEASAPAADRAAAAVAELNRLLAGHLR